MNVDSTMLVDHRLLPKTRPARCSHTISKMRPATPDTKNTSVTSTGESSRFRDGETVTAMCEHRRDYTMRTVPSPQGFVDPLELSESLEICPCIRVRGIDLHRALERGSRFTEPAEHGQASTQDVVGAG